MMSRKTDSDIRISASPLFSSTLGGILDYGSSSSNGRSIKGRRTRSKVQTFDGIADQGVLQLPIVLVHDLVSKISSSSGDNRIGTPLISKAC